MKNEGLRDHTRGEIHRLGQNPRGEDGSRICRALNLDRYESVEVLLRICRWQNHFDGLKSYREAIGQTKTFSMDRESVEKLSRQIPDSSMDQRCDKICREKKSKGLDR